MKIHNLQCPNCASSLEVEKEGMIECKYCHATFYAEFDKAPITMNTVINNYNSSNDYERYSRVQYKYNNKASIFGGIAFVIFIIIFYMLTMYDSRNNISDFIGDELAIEEIEDIDKIESYTMLSGADISFTRDMISLKELVLEDAAEIEDYSTLLYLPRIERLTIKNAVHLENLDFVKNMRALKYIYIENSAIKDLEPMRDRISVNELVLYKNSELTDLSAIESLKSLKSLKINGVDEGLIPDITGLKFLEDIEINKN